MDHVDLSPIAWLTCLERHKPEPSINIRSPPESRPPDARYRTARIHLQYIAHRPPRSRKLTIPPARHPFSPGDKTRSTEPRPSRSTGLRPRATPTEQYALEVRLHTTEVERITSSEGTGRPGTSACVCPHRITDPDTEFPAHSPLACAHRRPLRRRGHPWTKLPRRLRLRGQARGARPDLRGRWNAIDQLLERQQIQWVDLATAVLSTKSSITPTGGVAMSLTYCLNFSRSSGFTQPL